MEQLEHQFLCPYCNAGISVLLDPSVSNQHYIEDCEVCCRPLEIRYGINGEDLQYFEANALEQ